MHFHRHSRCFKHIAFARAAQRKRSRMGEGGRRPDEGASLVPVFQRHQYRVTHRIPRREHVGVAHAQHPPALLFQKPRAHCIVLHFFFAPVRCTINLNNQLGRAAGKICKVWPDGKLPHELETIEPATAQLFPQAAFGFSVVLAKGASAGSRCFGLVGHEDKTDEAVKSVGGFFL
jgi:hypothetical protein